MAKGIEVTAQKLYDIFNNRDWESLSSICDSGCTVTNMATGEQFKGIDGMRKWLQFWSKMCSDMRCDHIEAVGSSDRLVCIEGSARGKNDGEIQLATGTLPATGKKLHMQWVDLVELRNGKIAGIRCYFDTGRMFSQLGIQPPSQPYQPAVTGVAR